MAVKEGCGRERGVTVGRGGGVFMLDSSPLPFKEVMMVEEWIEGIAAVSLLASTLLPNDTSALARWGWVGGVGWGGGVSWRWRKVSEAAGGIFCTRRFRGALVGLR